MNNPYDPNQQYNGYQNQQTQQDFNPYQNNPAPQYNPQFNPQGGFNNNMPPKKDNSAKTLWIVFGIVAFILILIAVLVVVLVNRGKSSNVNSNVTSNYEYTVSETEENAETPTVPEITTAAPATVTMPQVTQPSNSINVLNDGVPSNRYLTATELKSVNIFLSNFAEVEFPNYSYNYNYNDMINFAILHNYINGNSSCKVNGSQVSISGDTVKKNISRFFGTSIPLSSTDIASYMGDGYFYTDTGLLQNKIRHSSSGYGKIYTFVVIDSISLYFDGAYGVQFKIYKTNTPISDAFYGYYPSQAQNVSGATVIGSGSATIRSTNNGRIDDSMKMNIVDYSVSY